VEVAAHHAEAIGKSAGMRVEKWFLLDGVALRARRVSPRDIELPAAIVANFADSSLAFGNRTAVSAREATQAIIFQLLDEARIGFADLLIENGAQGGRHLDLYFNASERRRA
jgi:hypothetical protein